MIHARAKKAYLKRIRDLERQLSYGILSWNEFRERRLIENITYEASL